NDLWDNARFFFVAPEEYDPKAVKKRWSADMPAIMTALADLLEKEEDFSCAALEPKVLGWIESNGYHLGNVMNAFRLTVVGECKGPHMFDITELMGRDETVRRIRAGVERIRPVE
ncbi:MAG: glutamate--tRNA ligase, partial [Muribaculaceae bacterium]|nr:glutamate--tRNA ligase [Muribaculaceae bacterium]